MAGTLQYVASKWERRNSKNEVQLFLIGLKEPLPVLNCLWNLHKNFDSFQAVIKTNSKGGHILVFFVVESDQAHKGIVTDWAQPTIFAEMVLN